MRSEPNIKHQFLIFTAPLFAALFLIFFIFFFIQKSTYLDVVKEEDGFYTDLAHSNIERFLRQSEQDLNYLINFDQLRQSTQPLKKEIIADQFKKFMQFRTHFNQIRYLDLEGNEVVRVENIDGVATIGHDAEFQSKSHQYYFTEAMKLRKNEIYSSPLDLNMEKSQVEFPKKPVIRMAMPVFSDKGEKTGILVINNNAQILINEFRLISSKVGNHLYLINEEGYWLINPDTSKEFSFMFNGDKRFSVDNPDEWDIILSANSGQFANKNGIFTFNSINQSDYFQNAPTDNRWIILALTSKQTILNEFKDIIKKLLIIGTTLTMLVVLVSWQLARARVQRILDRANFIDSERLNKSIVETSANSIISMNEKGILVNCNPAALRLFKRSIDDVKGFLFERTFLTVKQHLLFKEFLATTSAQPVGSHSNAMDFNAFSSTGTPIPVSITLSVDEIKGDKIITAFLTDNSEQLKNQALQRLTEVVFRATSEGITITDANNNIEAINPGFTEITGYTEKEIIGKNPRIMRSGKHSSEFYEDLWTQLHYNGIWHGEIWNRKKDGEIYPEEISIALVRDEKGVVQHHVAIFHDISKRKSREERIAYQAHYDQLTGLPNRFVFIDNLDREINSFRRYEDRFALLFIDLDDFKNINDTFGHRTGDLVLQEAAKRLTESVRDSDMVARLAGDEFTIIIRAIDKKEDLSRIIAKIRAGLEGEFLVGTNKVQIAGSIGGIIYDTEYGTADDLLHAADQAMYESKRIENPDS